MILNNFFISKERHLSKFLILILCLVLTIISMIVLPYQYGAEDQAIYIPIIEKQLNPSLFENDYLLKHHQQTTLFFPLVTFLIKIVGNMETVFFILYFLSLYLTFLGIYHLSKKIFNNHLVALVSVALFFFPKWVGGTGVQTYENYFLPRMLAIPFTLFTLILTIKKKWRIAAILASVSFLFHPVSAFPLILIFLVYLFMKRHEVKYNILIQTLVLLTIPSLFIILIAQKEFSQSVNFFLMPEEWLNITKQRDSFVFPQLWKLRSFGSLLIFYIFYLLFLLRKKIVKTKESLSYETIQFINLVTVISLCLPLLMILISEFLPITFLIQLEPARSVVIFSYFSILCFAFFAVYLIKSKINFLGKGITFLVLLIAILWNNTLIKKVDRNWMDIQLWAKNNTPINAIFLTPPLNKGFRTFSNRTIVGEYKDGGPVIYSYEFAREWNKRMKDLGQFDKLNEADFVRLSKLYQFDFLVVDKKHQFNFKKVYENVTYSVYSRIKD